MKASNFNQQKKDLKYAFILLFWVLVSGCDTRENREDLQNMFTKQTSEKYVIASPLEGTLLKEGKPLANTTIIRRLRWNGNEDGLVQTFTTDAKGRFSLPVHEEELSLGMLVQFVGKSEIYVGEKKDESLIWYSPKFSAHIYSETETPVQEMICDVSAPEIVVYMGAANILTKCHWRDMPEHSN